MDVRRSFNKINEISNDNLTNILKAYAIINPDLNYSQGMNYIAGFLYLTLNKEENLAFDSMK